MQPGEVRLGIDYGSAGAVAVLSWPGGRRVPLQVDGAPQLPAAIFVEPDGGLVTGQAAWQRAAAAPQRLVAAPLQRLGEGTLEVGGDTVEAMELVAVVLRRIAEEATRVAQRPVTDVRLVVPAGCGPRWRTALRQAAHRAGLGQPTLVEAPVAAARHLAAGGARLLVGSYLLVCDFGGGFEATVLRRTPTGFEILSTQDGADAGGLRLDEILADELAATANTPAADPGAVAAGERPMLLTSARAAKEALTAQAAVAVPLPAPQPAVVLNTAQLETLARPLMVRAAQLTRETVDAAGIVADELAGVFCIGGGATPLAARILREEASLTPVVVDQPQWAAVLGAAEAAGEPGEPGDEPPVPAAPLPPLRRAAAWLVPGAASLVLVFHFLSSGQRSGRSRGFPDPNAYVLANWGELAMAAGFALVAALCAATLIASTLPAQDRGPGRAGEPAQPTQQIGTGLLAATAAGLAVAALYAVAGSVYFDLPNGPFLRWALLPVLPIAAAAATTAVLATRWGRIPAEGWHAWLTFPVSSVLCAAVGMGLVQGSMTARVYPTHALANNLVGRGGALLLGAGAAFALVHGWRYRLIVAAPLAAFTMAIVSWPATGVLGVLYIAAATVWWLQRAWRLVRPPRRLHARRPAVPAG
jgi:hypothetical protein